MIRKLSAAGAVLFTALLISGCSLTQKSIRHPDFYPNEHLRAVGQAQAHQDTRYCMSLADEYVKEPEKWKDVATDSLGGAVLGTATGAVGGAIVGNTGRGVGIGAATGAIIGLVRGLQKAGDPNPTYERFVEQCLSEKGYRVYGWS